MAKIDVFNYTLVRLEQSTTSDPDSTTESNVIILNSVYETVKKALLRSHPYNFAVERQIPGLATGTPTFKWDYHFDKPSNWLRTLGVYEDDNEEVEADYEMAGDKILSDTNVIYLKYIKNISNESQFDPLFVEQCGLRLAIVVGGRITSDTALVNNLVNEWNVINPFSKFVDSSEMSQQVLEIDDFLSYRSGYRGKQRKAGT